MMEVMEANKEKKGAWFGLRKCVGFFWENELGQRSGVVALTSNNERVFSVFKRDTFPAVAVRELSEWIDRELKGGFGIPVEYARLNGKGAVYGEGYCSALEELRKELEKR